MVGLSSPISRPSLNALICSSVTSPLIRAKYVFATCLDGDKRLWDSSPSSVMSSSPSVSISSLPTGNRLFTGTEPFNRSRTVVCRLSLVALTQTCRFVQHVIVVFLIADDHLVIRNQSVFSSIFCSGDLQTVPFTDIIPFFIYCFTWDLEPMF